MSSVKMGVNSKNDEFRIEILSDHHAENGAVVCFVICTDFPLDERWYLDIDYPNGGVQDSSWSLKNLRQRLYSTLSTGVEAIIPKRYSVKVEVGRLFNAQAIIDAYVEVIESLYLRDAGYTPIETSESAVRSYIR